MEIQEKALVFEHSIGIMAVAHELYGITNDSYEVHQLLISALENEEDVGGLLAKFDSKNDFSKIKAFGLFHRITTNQSDVLLGTDGFNNFLENFEFANVDYTKNIEISLYDYFNNPDSTEVSSMEFTRAYTTVVNKEKLLKLVMRKDEYANQQSLNFANLACMEWIKKAENISDLKRYDWEFQKDPIPLNYLIYQID